MNEAIQKAMKNRTTVMITHRLENIVNADCIYVLGKHGNVVEKGTHSELMNCYHQNSFENDEVGLYKQLVMGMEKKRSEDNSDLDNCGDGGSVT